MKENYDFEQIESDLVDEICQKFRELGIDTSEWEYRFGDGNTAPEFIKAGIAWHLEKLNTPVNEDWKEAFENEKNEAGEEWVFETNGHKWSNNNNECGDNYGSFKEGAEWAKNWMETNLISKPLK